jgi:hypothetical protein
MLVLKITLFESVYKHIPKLDSGQYCDVTVIAYYSKTLKKTEITASAGKYYLPP